MTLKQNKSFTVSSNENTQSPLKVNSGNEEQTERNVGGRPKGAKNTLTLLQEAATEGIMTEVLTKFDRVVKTTIAKAEEGDPTCLKILWDRVIPTQKATDGKTQKQSGGITIVVQGTQTPRIAETIENYEEVIENNEETNDG